MAYTKTTWVDRNVQYPKRYTVTTIDADTIELDREPGTVTQAGTILNATKLNNIETGIETLDAQMADMPWESFEDVTLDADASQVDFTIPSDYTFCMIIGINMKMGGTATVSLRFNDDSSTNYTSAANKASLFNSPSNDLGICYTPLKYNVRKNMMVQFSTSISAQYWTGTEDVTKISLLSNNTNKILTGTRFKLLGMR